MAFKARLAFAVLCPFIVCGFFAARANAENPRNLRKLLFTEVKNTVEVLLKYPFTKDAFDDIKKYYITPNVPHDTKVYVAEIKDPYIKDVFLEYIEGSIACGIYCDF